MKLKDILDTAKGYKRTLGRLKDFVPSNSETSVLDLGAGSGQLTFPLSDIYDFVIGLEIDKAKIIEGRRIARLLEKSQKIDFILADGRSLPFKRSSFDAIFAFASLEHIKESNEVVHSLSMVLKNRGVLVAYLPHKSTRYARTLNKLTLGRACQSYLIEHVSAHDPDVWMRILVQNGFKMRSLIGQSLLPPIHWFLPIAGRQIYYALCSLLKNIDRKLSRRVFFVKKFAIAIFLIAQKVREPASIKLQITD